MVNPISSSGGIYDQRQIVDPEVEKVKVYLDALMQGFEYLLMVASKGTGAQFGQAAADLKKIIEKVANGTMSPEQARQEVDKILGKLDFRNVPSTDLMWFGRTLTSALNSRIEKLETEGKLDEARALREHVTTMESIIRNPWGTTEELLKALKEALL